MDPVESGVGGAPTQRLLSGWVNLGGSDARTAETDHAPDAVRPQAAMWGRSGGAFSVESLQDPGPDKR